MFDLTVYGPCYFPIQISVNLDTPEVPHLFGMFWDVMFWGLLLRQRETPLCEIMSLYTLITEFRSFPIFSHYTREISCLLLDSLKVNVLYTIFLCPKRQNV